jgi:hypothetical protein
MITRQVINVDNRVVAITGMVRGKDIRYGDLYPVLKELM